MEDPQIVSLEPQHIAQVENWASRHTATNILFKTSVESGGHYTENYGWAVLVENEVLAIATVKLNKEHVGYLNCIVKPASKRKGVGTSLVQYVLNQPVIKDLVHLHAAIDPANTAARQVLKEQGFTPIGDSSDGYLEYAKHMHY